MRRVLPDAVLGEIGMLDPAAIAEVRADAWPDVRDAEELHDALLTLIAIPIPTNLESFGSNPLRTRLQESMPAWSDYFEQLAAQRRAGLAQLGENIFWFAAERARTFVQIFPSAQFSSALPEVESAAPSREAALLALVTGWMGHAGPITSAQLASVLALPVSEIDKTLLRLEASGLILRGKFTSASNQPVDSNR